MMVLSQLEENIYELSLDEQLWLVERLVQHIRQAMTQDNNLEHQLIAVANDPKIQDELQIVETELVVTDADGFQLM
ncbi:MAG: hypothetical protein AAF485_15345 [Chloroflexota bacterium]